MASDRSSSAVALPSYAKAVEAYRKAVATAATVTAYVVLARGMAWELLPYDLREAARWAASLIRARLEPPPVERRTLVIKRFSFSGGQLDGGGGLYDEVREYLATRIDPHAMRRLCLRGGSKKNLSMEDGDSMTDVFEGVVFTWASVAGQSSKRKHGNGNGYGYGSLELSFDAEHTDMALERYVPFITATVAEAQRMDRALQIFMNEGSSWHGITHHHPSTFDTLAMDPALKQSIVDDLDRFLGRRDYYRRIGKAWKRGYLLYGPPGTGKSSLVAAMANYLRFNLYDLDLSEVRLNSALQKLLIHMPNKSMLVIEDIDCCFDDAAASRKAVKAPEPVDDLDMDPDYTSDSSDENWAQPGFAPLKPKGITLSGLLNFIDGLWSTCGEERIIVFTTNYKVRYNIALQRLLTAMPNKSILVIEDIDCCFSTKSRKEEDDLSDQSHLRSSTRSQPGITLSGLLNFIDGLWSTSGEERIIIFTTNYKDRLDPALLRTGRMDMHIYMGYCGWEAFRTLARNYFLDDHARFPEIQELLSGVEVTPAEVSEMLLRSEDVDVALRMLAEFLAEKKRAMREGESVQSHQEATAGNVTEW